MLPACELWAMEIGTQFHTGNSFVLDYAMDACEQVDFRGPRNRALIHPSHTYEKKFFYSERESKRNS
uniref:Uncharacterized protein n=1 Tax=Bacillus thuringiensis serovar chinensis CT-43 TaxID=541229 RepID=E7CGR6_BACTU|nr:hypothetical protein pBMB0558_00715 [Bacillus thuringiensis serovar chinensis CT-43]